MPHLLITTTTGGLLLRLLTLVLPMLCAACAGNRTVDSRQNPDLQALLQTEFQRLGIDPGKVTFKAPAGKTNYVFDLAARPVDSNTADAIPADSVQLTWTERTQGDYDANGIVNISDLTALGQRIGQTVEYNPPADLGGVQFWPVGDAATDPFGNWKSARVDGDGNGQISAADITPIAVHWNENLSGYRVYRRQTGEVDWTLVQNPQQTELEFTVARPAVNQAGLFRYTFDDQPPAAGNYEYRVVAFDDGDANRSASESLENSNIASVSLAEEFADTLPPVWDTTVGITAATANPDGTVTIEFGAATDVAPPWIDSHPPVSYTVYWSRETPLDFSNAAKAADIASGWSSSALLPGTEYHFAVRASDSAPMSNMDTNTVVLPVTTAGETVEDTEPPVWSEFYDTGNTDYYSGIRSAIAGDGVIHITCADATDDLSPPVHYDLHYVSARDFPEISGTADFPFSEATLVSDIPKHFTLEWENRHELLLRVTAWDSANPPNGVADFRSVRIAPTDLRKLLPDPLIPGISAESSESTIVAIPDIGRKKVYSVYASGPDKASRKGYFLELDVVTGEWEGELLFEDPQSLFGFGQYVLVRAPSGSLWLRIKVYTGAFGVGFYRYFRRSAGGTWSEVEISGDPDGFWNGILDQNEYPVFVSYGGSPEEGEYPLKLHFLEEDGENWRTEVACDYADYPIAFWRPDGFMQLVTTHEGTTADSIPRYVMERSIDGEWTEVFAGFGQTSPLPVTEPQWDAEIAWSVLTDMRGDLELLAYGTEGYQFLPADGIDPDIRADDFDTRKNDPYLNQAWDAGSMFHALPYWLYKDGLFTEYSYRAADELGNWQDGPSHALEEAKSYRAFGGRNDSDEENGQLIWMDPVTGDCAFVGIEDNLVTNKQQVYMLTTIGKEASVFDPLTWE